METVERDYSPKGVKFFYIYKALAHPETNNYITPFSLKERLMHVAEAKRTLGSRITWLCDTMKNDAKHTLGNAPNSEFVIDPRGKIVVARQWSRPGELREDLAEFVGKAPTTTSPADLNMKRQPPPQRAPTGIVPRVRLQGRMSPVLVNPLADKTAKQPFYVKLRVEADQNLMANGDGKLYLGFFLDPLYKVHWNNKVAPVHYEIKAPRGLTVEPSEGDGPKVKQAADADPREFVLNVSGRASGKLRVTVRYFACDDAETFCVPVTQEYEVTLERDRDGGSRRSSRGRGGRGLAGGPDRGRPFGRGRGGNGPRGGQPRRADPQTAERGRLLRRAVQAFRQFDANRDGALDAAEIAKSRRPIAKADANGDQKVTLNELVQFLSKNKKGAPPRQRSGGSRKRRDSGKR